MSEATQIFTRGTVVEGRPEQQPNNRKWLETVGRWEFLAPVFKLNLIVIVKECVIFMTMIFLHLCYDCFEMRQ
ncbi:MAG: hypothetical protein AAFR22_14725 [Chloroflexota bacterium]